MKIGILSDIHAHLAPLERALALFQAQQVEMILCAGDLVDRGLEADEVVARIRAENIPCVMGNHDEWVANWDSLPYAPETLDYLLNLPDYLQLEVAGKRIVVAHGTPRDNSEYVYPAEKTHYLWNVFSLVPADILILGHTHYPMKIYLGEGMILNAGALYGNRTDGEEQTCGILTLPSGHFEVFDVNTGKEVNFELRFVDDV